MPRKILFLFFLPFLCVRAVAQAPVPVLQNPAAGANQNIVQLPDTTMHNPSSFSANNEAGIRYVVPSYNWIQSPSQPPSIPSGTSSVTVTLNPCPAGMLVLPNAQPFTRLYLAGTGTPEAVPVTATSCPLQGGGTGTVTITTQFSHSQGYTLGSASQGIQEAINAANSASTNFPNQLGKVVIPPGDYTALARISILGHKQEIQASGAVLTCTMADTCVFVGDNVNENFTFDVTIDGLAVRAGLSGGKQTAIEDNGQHTTLRNIGTRSSLNSGTFFSVIQIDDDQSAVIEKFDPSLARNWAHCGTDWCSVAIYGPGPFSTNAGVLWVKDSEISAQCLFNGIDNQDANALRVSDTVVQGYPQFGIRATGNNNNVAAILDNVHLEVGDCSNPLGTGIAGFISEGFFSVLHGTLPAGVLPQFGTGSTGNLYAYYVVVKSTVSGATTASAPYLAGYAFQSSSLPITVNWPQVGTTGTVTYDLLRQSVPNLGISTTAPYGTGSFAVAQGIQQSANCSNKVCSFMDQGNATTVYMVVSPSAYAPGLTFWPGSVVLTPPADSPISNGGEPRLFTDMAGQTGISVGGYVNSYGANAPTVFAQQCSGPSAWSSIWMSCPAGDSIYDNYAPVGALLLQVGAEADDANAGGLKGRLNLMAPSGLAAATHLITLGDSNPAKTLATPGHRPSNDAADTWIGLDVANGSASTFGLAFGAPVSISNYIANNGGGTQGPPLEVLTSTTKTFGNTIQIVSTLPTSAGPPFSVLSSKPVGTLTVSNHPTLQSCGATVTCSHSQVTLGQMVFGTLPLSSGSATLTGIAPAFTSATSFNCVANDTTNQTNGVNAVPQSGSRVLFTGAANDTISYQCVGN